MDSLSLGERAGVRAGFRRFVLGLVTCVMGLTAGSLQATNHQIRFNEIMVGLNGDFKIQFVEIVAFDDCQKVWGPGSDPCFVDFVQPIGRAMLTFHNAADRTAGLLPAQ